MELYYSISELIEDLGQRLDLSSELILYFLEELTIASQFFKFFLDVVVDL